MALGNLFQAHLAADRIQVLISIKHLAVSSKSATKREGESWELLILPDWARPTRMLFLLIDSRSILAGTYITSAESSTLPY
jgi:hypothetical protein